MLCLYHILGKKKVFETFFIREHLCAVLKTSFLCFWCLPAGSREACLSSSLFHFELHGDTFLASSSADLACMQSEKDPGGTVSFLSGKAGTTDNVMSFPETWQDGWQKNETELSNRSSLGAKFMSHVVLELS